MMRAYGESYLPHVRDSLGTAFEIAFSEGMEIDEISDAFVVSKAARLISIGDPKHLAGMSGHELCEEIFGISSDIQISIGSGYWLGHTLAYIQWYWCVPFGSLEASFPMRDIYASYNVLHESDISKITEIAGRRLHSEPVIRARRKALGITQRQLSDITGISLHTIRAYEQGNLSVANAESGNIFELSKALGCSMEEILRGNVVFKRSHNSNLSPRRKSSTRRSTLRPL